MDISTHYRNNGSVLVIDIGEKFDFGKVEDFRNSYSDLPHNVAHIVIDLAKTEYMDSSALGMLLNMQKALVDRSLKYTIENTRPPVARILKISRFDKKFDIN